MKICPNCRYERTISDDAPSWQCPSCKKPYISGGKSSADTPVTRPHPRAVATPPIRTDAGSKTPMIVVGCMLLVLAGFGFWKYKHHAHVSPEQVSAEGFDAAKKAFDEDNYRMALKGFAPLAEAGNPKAQYFVGRMFGVTWNDNPFDSNSLRHNADPAQQIVWYTKSAEQGEVLSQIALANLYGNGFGPNADRTPSMHWWQMAADQGDASAQYKIAESYDQGNINAQDYAQALVWYRKSAAQGYGPSMRGLGYLYYRGNGVVAGPKIAYEFFSLSEAIEARNPEQRSGYSTDLIKQLSVEMTENERAEANQFVADWKKGQSLPQ